MSFPSRLADSGDADSVGWEDWAAGVLVAGAVVPIAFHYAMVLADVHSVNADIEDWWVPLAKNVVRGADLYAVPEAADMKPPGWLMFIVLSELTIGVPGGVFALTALGNGLVIWIVYDVGGRVTDDKRMALVAAAIILLAVNNIAAGGNNKSIVAALLLLSLLASTPLRSGLLAGIGVMIIQYGGFGLPVVAFVWWRREGRREALVVLVSAASVVVACFLAVAAIWGIDSFTGAIWYTFGIVGRYLTQSGQIPNVAESYGTGSIVASPYRWFAGFFGSIYFVRWILIAALFGLCASLFKYEEYVTDDLFAGVVLLGVSLFPSLLVRNYSNYWVLLLGPLGVLAAVGLHELRSSA